MNQQTSIPFSASLPSVVLTTDGGCWPNPGRGAWAFVLRFGTAYKELAGCPPHAEVTTNNRMEMTAIIEGLKALKKPCAVTIRTDSMYCLYAINGGSKKKKAKVRKNLDLIALLQVELAKHTASAMFVRGHCGDVDNERCDKLCMELIGVTERIRLTKTGEIPNRTTERPPHLA